MSQSSQIQNQSMAQLATALRRSVSRLARRLRGTHPAGNTTPAQLGILRTLHEHGAMTAGQIAAADFLQPQSVTRLLASLDQAGLIARAVDDHDRRRAVVSITREGAKALRANAVHRDEWLAQAMQADLNPAELAILRQASELLERLASQGN